MRSKVQVTPAGFRESGKHVAILVAGGRTTAVECEVGARGCVRVVITNGHGIVGEGLLHLSSGGSIHVPGARTRTSNARARRVLLAVVWPHLEVEIVEIERLWGRIVI